MPLKTVWGEVVKAYYEAGPGGAILSSYVYFKSGKAEDPRFLQLCAYRKGEKARGNDRPPVGAAPVFGTHQARLVPEGDDRTE
jgi:hypothetical protein